MENASITNNLKYTKGKKSFERLSELERFGLDPARIQYLPWFDSTKVLAGTHMDNDKAVGNQYVGWVLYEDCEVRVKTFGTKGEAQDWVLAKGELHIRKRKMSNQMILYKMLAFIILLVALVIILVIKVYN